MAFARTTALGQLQAVSSLSPNRQFTAKSRRLLDRQHRKLDCVISLGVGDELQRTDRFRQLVTAQIQSAPRRSLTNPN